MKEPKAPAGFVCATCGKAHDDLPDIGCEFPDPYLDVPPEERATRTTASADLCIVRHPDEGDDYFVRAVIEIPIHHHPEVFGIGVWVSQSREHYEQYARGEVIPPSVGYISNKLECYEPTTFLLRGRLHFRDGGLRPTVELQPTDHPLAVDQRNGISKARAWEMVHSVMPNDAEHIVFTKQ